MSFHTPMDTSVSLAFYLLEVVRDSNGTPLPVADILEVALQRRQEDAGGADPLDPAFRRHVATILEDMVRLGLIETRLDLLERPCYAMPKRTAAPRVPPGSPDGCDSGIQEVLLHPVLFCVEPNELDPIVASATERF